MFEKRLFALFAIYLSPYSSINLISNIITLLIIFESFKFVIADNISE